MNKLFLSIKNKSFPIVSIELLSKDIKMFIILISIQILIKNIKTFFTFFFLQSIKTKHIIQTIEIINDKSETNKTSFLIAKNPTNK